MINLMRTGYNHQFFLQFPNNVVFNKIVSRTTPALHGMPNRNSSFLHDVNWSSYSYKKQLQLVQSLIHITSTLNNTEESIVSFEWDYFSDGAPVNYSVTVMGDLENDTVSALTVEMRVELTLRYNTEHAVTVEVISCAESNFSSIFTLELSKRDF